MECTEARAAFRDWAAAPAEARNHLVACSECAFAWERGRELSEALASLRLRTAGASASRSVRAAVLEALPPAPRAPWIAWRPLVAVTAVLVMAITAGWYFTRHEQRARPQPTQAAEAALYTDFFPLSAVALDRQDAAHMVRIRLPRREMRRFGLPVSEEFERSSIEADVLIGQDGVARAVRFVSRSH